MVKKYKKNAFVNTFGFINDAKEEKNILHARFAEQ